MSGIFLLYEFTITSGLNIFYLHLETGLVTSKKYWRVSSKGPFLKEVIQGKLYFYEILAEIQMKEERLNFLKVLKFFSLEHHKYL